MKRLFPLLILLVFIFACGEQECDCESECESECVKKEIINTEEAPVAIGPYSQAVKVGNMLYLSGQLGMDPATGEFAEGGIEAQARQALNNQAAILKAAGFCLKDVVQCQVFVKNMDDYAVFNTVYKEFFKGNFPARAVLEVSRIPAGGLCEVMMVAVKGPDCGHECGESEK
jgi:2-iminobutanoate/2-iminopropanoate deaminase